MNNDHNVILFCIGAKYSGLVKVAVRYQDSGLIQEALKYWGEPDSQKLLLDRLPLHLRDLEKILDVQEISAIVA